MTTKAKIITSVSTLLALTSVAVGTTYALFSTTKTVNNHIKAGGLIVDFYLTELVVDELSNVGAITEKTVDLTAYTGYEAGKGVNLKVYTGEIVSIEKFVPSMKGHAIFSVGNVGTVGYTYSLEVINKAAEWKDGTDKTADFDTVMNIDVTGTSSATVNVGDKITTNRVDFEFLSTAANDWQESSFSFDIQLSATQIVAE